MTKAQSHVCGPNCIEASGLHLELVVDIVGQPVKCQQIPDGVVHMTPVPKVPVELPVAEDN